MPLNPTSMQLAFQDLAMNYPDKPEDVAKKMADAYDKYAQGALALGGTPIFTGSEKKVIESTLLPVLKNQNGVIAAYATAWYTAVVAYWAPVVWNPPVPATHGPGVVTIPPLPTIQVQLIAGMSAPNEAPVWAQLQATALHTGIAGIMTVTFPPIPPTPSPLLAPVL